QQEIRDRMGDIDQFFQNSHYNIIRLLLRISGLWPFHTRNRRYAIYFAMVLILGSGFIFQILGIIEIWHDPFELLDTVPSLFFTVVIISKTFCSIHALPQIKMLLIKMHEYCLSPKSDEEEKIQNSHALYGKKLGYVYTGFILSQTILYLFTPLFTKFSYVESNKTNELANEELKSQKELPYRVNYMIDLDTYFVPIFIHCTVCNLIYIVLLFVLDVLYLIVIEYSCGLFVALRSRLEIASVSKLTMTKNKCYSNIVYTIHRHTETIQFVAIVESAYSLALSIQTGLIVFIISFLGYQVIKNVQDVNRLVNLFAYLNPTLFILFFVNWQGQKIIDSSEKVFESAYNSEWYNMPIAARKLLIMIMMRSEKPLELRMSKIVVLSNITFNTVLRMSSSYFMLLRSL
ncbi:OR67C protein, partial [Acromyrmex heyeri]